jgi:hypothetical protein
MEQLAVVPSEILVNEFNMFLNHSFTKYIF